MTVPSSKIKSHLSVSNWVARTGVRVRFMKKIEKGGEGGNIIPVPCALAYGS